MEQCFYVIDHKITEGQEVSPEEKQLHAKLKEDREQLAHKCKERKKFYKKHHQTYYRYKNLTRLDFADGCIAAGVAGAVDIGLLASTIYKEKQLIKENMNQILPLQQDYVNKVVLDAANNYGANFIPNVNTIVTQIKNFAGPEGYKYHSHAYDFWTTYAMEVEINLKHIARDFVAVDFTTPLQLGLGVSAGVVGAWAICYAGRRLYRKLSAISLEKKGDKIGEEITQLLSQIDENTKELKECIENPKKQTILSPAKYETQEKCLETTLFEETVSSNTILENKNKYIETLKLEQEKLQETLLKLEQEKTEIEKKLNDLRGAEDAYSKKIETPKNELEMGL